MVIKVVQHSNVDFDSHQPYMAVLSAKGKWLVGCPLPCNLMTSKSPFPTELAPGLNWFSSPATLCFPTALPFPPFSYTKSTQDRSQSHVLTLQQRAMGTASPNTPWVSDRLHQPRNPFIPLSCQPSAAFSSQDGSCQ